MTKKLLLFVSFCILPKKLFVKPSITTFLLWWKTFSLISFMFSSGWHYKFISRMFTYHLIAVLNFIETVSHSFSFMKILELIIYKWYMTFPFLFKQFLLILSCWVQFPNGFQVFFWHSFYYLSLLSLFN